MTDTSNAVAQFEKTTIEGEQFYKIAEVNTLRPFFMSVVSNTNHWMFISSNGGLSAGRKDADHALFPYYTDDKITESAAYTGSLTMIRVLQNGRSILWEPFREKKLRNDLQRNLYKSPYGNKIIFEEINHALGLTFRYGWSFSNRYGFIRRATLINHKDESRKVEILDGIQNLLPSNVPSDLQNQASNLVDAYKRSELDAASGMGIYALSAIIVDKAEPSEALKANIAWSTGLNHPTHLLSSLQIQNFRNEIPIREETDIKGEKGAYLLHSTIDLLPHQEKEWWIAADVNKDHSRVVSMMEELLHDESLSEKIQRDIDEGTRHLRSLVASADGLQKTSDHLRDARHYSNVLFNIMRGGVFADNYSIDRKDFESYFEKANKNLFKRCANDVMSMPQQMAVSDFRTRVESTGSPDFIRLAYEYLPLMFSRRHGDPSRPWNEFSINTQSEHDGSRILDYQGNWRDIFQNWEALAVSYPGFLDGMIFKFLNASTFDGYNPYRIFKDGFDWETIEPDDPWSYIGYWGDHQIIYLLKFLEAMERLNPGRLSAFFDQELFVYAAVPYVIKSYEEMLEDPKETILFDHEWDASIRKKRGEIGADGALLKDESGQTIHVNLIEKLLATALAKLSNFVPDAGIWMNTQRPEWNDANNALVGNGASMVTLYYLRRYLAFVNKLLEKAPSQQVKVSAEFVDYYHGIRQVFAPMADKQTSKWSDEERRHCMDRLGAVASDYRNHIYQSGFWGKKRSIGLKNITEFLTNALSVIDVSVRNNRRPAGTYHAYNLITTSQGSVKISHLDNMLEGQVAVLSSELLSPEEALDVLDAMKASKIFRPDQYSYMLYPNKDIKGFLDRNRIPRDLVLKSELLQNLVWDENHEIIIKDVRGAFHFNGDFKNANDLKAALKGLDRGTYGNLMDREEGLILSIFEEVFNHKAFTGRSGTFFGYEGLGSIYWHMVSKLLLATQECALAAIEENASEEIVGYLLDHYYEIQAGIGVHKSPQLYGAFPTDPYSHTPEGRGAQQPGMTGQVKEDVLARFGELGVFVHRGRIQFHPYLLREALEFVKEPTTFHYFDVRGEEQSLTLNEGALAFTYCQVPVVYTVDDIPRIVVHRSDGEQTTIHSLELDQETSDAVFWRTGQISRLVVHVTQIYLK